MPRSQEEQEFLRIQIQELINKQETAILSHPEELSALYFDARSARISELGEMTNWPQGFNPGVALEDFKLLLKLELCSSFISAWYHLVGDVEKRNVLTNNFCIIATGLRIDVEFALPRYVESEQKWRQKFKDAKVFPAKGGCVGFLHKMAPWLFK